MVHADRASKLKFKIQEVQPMMTAKRLNEEHNKWSRNVPNLIFDCSSYNSPLSKFKYVQMFEKFNVVSVAKYYVSVEELCDNYVDSHVDHMLASKKDYHCSASLSVETAYHNPRLVSYRTPMKWKGHSYILPSQIKPMWCRLFTHYIDWLSHIPELSALTTDDQLILMMSRYVPIVNLLCAYRAIKYKIKGLVLSGETIYPRDMIEQVQIDKRICFKQTNFIYDEFILPAKHMHLSESEYALLRVLAYLMPTDSMSEKGKIIIREASNFYREALCTLIRKSNPQSSYYEIIDRVTRIMYFLTVMERSKQETNVQYSIMMLFNIPQLNENLIFNVHVNNDGGA
uniref:NR LBD domain-containing protein n=1 Tax=Panagrolaimus sp. JU765 TaxID=591449 RepID=A0AC34QM68_9BILA